MGSKITYEYVVDYVDIILSHFPLRFFLDYLFLARFRSILPLLFFLLHSYRSFYLNSCFRYHLQRWQLL